MPVWQNLMSTAVSWQYKCFKYIEIPFIGYLIMTQFVDFKAI